MSTKVGITIIILLTLSRYSTAQRTHEYADPYRAYRQGIERYDQHDYTAAREWFQKIYDPPKTAIALSHEILMQNLEFYIAACATETNDKDAEQLLLAYIHKYYETDKRKLIYFYLGKYYFQNNKFTDASEWLAKVDRTTLSPAQAVEYKFDLAYSFFIKKKFDEAKPLFHEIKDTKEKYFYPANYYYAFICFYQKDYRAALKSFRAIEDSKMYAAVIPYYIAQIHYLNKSYDTAIAYLNRAIDRPEVQYQGEMRHLLGESYFQTSDYVQAEPLLEEFVSKNEKVRKDDLYELGYSQYQNGHYEEAIIHLQQLNLLPELLGQHATYALADCYLKTSQKDKARSAYQSASTMDFDKSIQKHSLFQYGKLSYELDYTQDAITALEKYLKENAQDTYTDEANELLAGCLLRSKDYARACRLMESLPRLSPVLRAAYQRAACYHAIELSNDDKCDEAITYCEKSLKYPIADEIRALAYFSRAECHYQMKDYEGAIESYGTFTNAIRPEMEQSLHVSAFRAEYGVAYCYFKLKNYRASKLHFHQAIDMSADSRDRDGVRSLTADLYLRYAECCLMTKDYPPALNAYDKVATNDWIGAEYAWYQKAIVQGLMGNNSDKITTLRVLIARYDKSNYVPMAWYEIGETYLDMEDNAAAITAYSEVTQHHPNSKLMPDAYLKTGLALYNMGKKDDALATYKKTANQYPNTKQSKSAIAAIRDLSIELGRPDEYADYSTSAAERDSLTYQAAENAYYNNDCAKANPIFTSYCIKFPKGIFINEAHYFHAECLLRDKQFAAAYQDYQAVIANKYAKFYERALLNASGIAYYEIKDTAAAYTLYLALSEAATTPANTMTATLGVMKTAYYTAKYAEAITFADKEISHSGNKEGDVHEALFIKGKSALALHQPDVAYIAFNRLATVTVSERAAEAKYRAAQILYDRGEYKASLDSCFKLKNRFAGYDYWVVRGFLLIADNYSALGNSFQAKATLESIVDNYQGEQANEIVKEARSKMERIQADALKKSKIETIVPPTDSIQIERDSVIKR